MGQRANFVLVDDTGWRLYYDHWAANQICSVLVAGPEAATRFIIAQRQRAQDEWLDDIWAEGGAMVDHRTRRLIFYGDQLMLDLPAKRVFTRLLSLTWPGWDVRWAYDGLGDFAAHVGLDRAIVRAARDPEMPGDLQPNPSKDWPPHLVTVRDEAGRLLVYPFDWADDHSAWQGPGLLDRLPAGGLAQVHLPVIPDGGLHVDVRSRTVGAWSNEPVPGLLPALTDLWPGWQMDFWEDRYEEQARRCGDAITFPPLDLAVALDELFAAIAERFGKDPVPDMLALAYRPDPDTGEVPDVELNPLFTAHTPDDPTPTEWSTVLRAAADLRSDL
ncbi:hypothetical protein [Actinoallomurus sp. CA-150999]|uniref:hypothetical protein n=1 Tax=Actinoallomurus sp. CA-150999 TaxID=3239887 RepID=UPI003D8CF252